MLPVMPLPFLPAFHDRLSQRYLSRQWPHPVAACSLHTVWSVRSVLHFRYPVIRLLLLPLWWQPHSCRLKRHLNFFSALLTFWDLPCIHPQRILPYPARYCPLQRKGLLKCHYRSCRKQRILHQRLPPLEVLLRSALFVNHFPFPFFSCRCCFRISFLSFSPL